MSEREFINSILAGAVRLQSRYGLPAAAIIAQVCLETGFGKHVVKDIYTGQQSFNLFNIKGMGPAGQVRVRTWEFLKGVKVHGEEKFRAYSSYQESFDDYAALITGSSRYARAVQAGKDPDKYAQALQQSGYATDPGYALKISRIMDSQKLREMVVDFIWD